MRTIEECLKDEFIDVNDYVDLREDQIIDIENHNTTDSDFMNLAELLSETRMYRIDLQTRIILNNRVKELFEYKKYLYEKINSPLQFFKKKSTT